MKVLDSNDSVRPSVNPADESDRVQPRVELDRLFRAPQRVRRLRGARRQGPRGSTMTSRARRVRLMFERRCASGARECLSGKWRQTCLKKARGGRRAVWSGWTTVGAGTGHGVSEERGARARGGARARKFKSRTIFRRLWVRRQKAGRRGQRRRAVAWHQGMGGPCLVRGGPTMKAWAEWLMVKALHQGMGGPCLTHACACVSACVAVRCVAVRCVAVRCQHT